MALDDFMAKWVPYDMRQSIIDAMRADLSSLLMAEQRAAYEQAARVIETWADDHLTIQPSFTRITATIRRLAEAKR